MATIRPSQVAPGPRAATRPSASTSTQVGTGKRSSTEPISTPILETLGARSCHRYPTPGPHPPTRSAAHHNARPPRQARRVPKTRAWRWMAASGTAPRNGDTCGLSAPGAGARKSWGLGGGGRSSERRSPGRDGLAWVTGAARSARGPGRPGSMRDGRAERRAGGRSGSPQQRTSAKQRADLSRLLRITLSQDGC